MRFVAKGQRTMIRFASLTDSARGPALDNVTVSRGASATNANRVEVDARALAVGGGQGRRVDLRLRPGDLLTIQVAPGDK